MFCDVGTRRKSGLCYPPIDLETSSVELIPQGHDIFSRSNGSRGVPGHDVHRGSSGPPAVQLRSAAAIPQLAGKELSHRLEFSA